LKLIFLLGFLRDNPFFSFVFECLSGFPLPISLFCFFACGLA
jgi:hypothetical protein